MADEETCRAKHKLDDDDDASVDDEPDSSMLFKRPRLCESDNVSDISDDTGNADGKIPALLPTRKEFSELRVSHCVVMSTTRQSCYEPMFVRPSLVVLELDDATLSKVSSMPARSNYGSIVDPETFADHLFVLADICEEAVTTGDLTRASETMSIASSRGIVCTAYSILPDDVAVGELRGFLFLSAAMAIDK